MSTRYLLVADPVDSLNPEFDLGVCVSTELISRGIAVDYLDLPATDPEQSSEDYLANLPVRGILPSAGMIAPLPMNQSRRSGMPRRSGATARATSGLSGAGRKALSSIEVRGAQALGRRSFSCSHM